MPNLPKENEDIKLSNNLCQIVIQVNSKFKTSDNGWKIDFNNKTKNNQDKKKNKLKEEFEIEVHYKKDISSKKIRLLGNKFYERYKSESISIEISNQSIGLKEFVDIEELKLENNVPLIAKIKIAKYLDNLNYMFADCKDIDYIIGLDKLVNEKVTNISNMFLNCTSLSRINNLNKFNTKNVRNMNSMFRDCTNLESLPELFNFNTENVNDMTSLFYNCKNLKGINLTKWDTKNVRFLSGIFYGCSKLETISNNVSRFNVSKVENMSLMFYR